MNPSKYVSVDDLKAQTSLPEAAAKCGVTLNVHCSGRQVRLDCPFNCQGDHADKREISVDTGNPQKVFACQAYGCQVRGNLLTLMHSWLTGTRPTDDKLKVEEFKRVWNALKGGDNSAPVGKEPSAKNPTQTQTPLDAALEQSLLTLFSFLRVATSLDLMLSSTRDTSAEEIAFALGSLCNAGLVKPVDTLCDGSILYGITWFGRNYLSTLQTGPSVPDRQLLE